MSKGREKIKYKNPGFLTEQCYKLSSLRENVSRNGNTVTLPVLDSQTSCTWELFRQKEHEGVGVRVVY